jgi:diguanylate cyclase (GGDEF)-like protein
MADKAFSRAARHFVAELDEAAQWHMAWTRMVLRCAVLRTHPGEDVLSSDAHHCCRFDQWLESHREPLARIDAATLRRLDRNHRQMHEAARRICGRILSGDPGEPADLDDFEHAQAGVVAALSLLKNAYLAHSARIDALTGLPLRHGLEEDFGRCRAQARRHGELLVVMMLDLDHFKNVNDLHGHAVGDLALRHTATLLKHHCRAGEPVIRYGGEEFLALLQAADRNAAQRAVQRILQALRDSPLNLPGGLNLDLRASAGLAEVEDGESMTDAIARADRALYVAKCAGRDAWRWADHRTDPATAGA